MGSLETSVSRKHHLLPAGTKRGGVGAGGRLFILGGLSCGNWSCRKGGACWKCHLRLASPLCPPCRTVGKTCESYPQPSYVCKAASCPARQEFKISCHQGRERIGEAGVRDPPRAHGPWGELVPVPPGRWVWVTLGPGALGIPGVLGTKEGAAEGSRGKKSLALVPG